MSIIISNQLDAQLIDQHGKGDPSAQDAIRAQHIAHIIYLLENVAPEDKNPLIVNKIRHQRFERFDMAKGWAEGDAYYKYFLSTLDAPQLEKLLADIRVPFDQRIALRLKTAMAFESVFKSRPVMTPDRAIRQSIDAFGDFFATTLRDEQRRQYLQANRDFPDRALENHELNDCGKPCKGIFLKFHPKIKDPQKKLKFNQVVRKTLNNEQLSSYQIHGRMLYAASRLADLLDQEGELQAAMEIRAMIAEAGFNPRRQNAVAPNKSILEKSLDRLARFMANVKQNLKLRPSRGKRLKLDHSSKAKPRPVPKPTGHKNSDAAKQLHELSERIATLMPQLGAGNPVPAPVMPNQSQGLTFAYDQAQKKDLGMQLQPEFGSPRGTPTIKL